MKTEDGTRVYPTRICWDCGSKWGTRADGVSTYYRGSCGVCGLFKAVTQPEEFGNPGIPGFAKP